MAQVLNKVKDLSSKKKIFSGLCNYLAEKSGIKVTFIRVTVLIVATFITFLPIVVGYIVGSVILCKHMKNKQAEPTVINPNNW